MFRSLLCAATICAVVLSASIFSPKAAACPVRIPETLLALYRNSKEIHIARFDKKLVESISAVEKEYSTANVRYYFDVSSTLKGESRKMFAYADTEYVYRPEKNEPVEVVQIDDENDGKVKAGETVLLFLKDEEPDEEEAAADKSDRKPELVLTDESDGLKRVSDRELRVYESRINELNGIFRDGRENDAAVLQWLIRCIEDPVTRWDGAYDLSSSFRAMEREASLAVAGESKMNVSFALYFSGTRNPQYARLMSDAQKQAVVNILIDPPAAQRTKEEKEYGLSRGDRMLIELVRAWADTKVSGYLLQRLRGGRDERWDVSSVMESIAYILEDEDVTTASEAYADAIDGDDNALVVRKDDADEEENKPAEPESSASPEADQDGSNADDRAIAVRQRLTYLEFRSVLLAKFIAAADIAIARPKPDETVAEN